MMVWKIIFLFNWVIFRFHVNLPGCIWTYSNVLVLSLVYALWVYACTGNQIVITQFSLLGTASQKSRSCLLAAYIMIFLSWEITIWDGTVGREVEQQEKLQKLERRTSGNLNCRKCCYLVVVKVWKLHNHGPTIEAHSKILGSWLRYSSSRSTKKAWDIRHVCSCVRWRHYHKQFIKPSPLGYWFSKPTASCSVIDSWQHLRRSCDSSRLILKPGEKRRHNN